MGVLPTSVPAGKHSSVMTSPISRLGESRSCFIRLARHRVWTEATTTSAWTSLSAALTFPTLRPGETERIFSRAWSTSSSR
jgi:hypothetical protein